MFRGSNATSPTSAILTHYLPLNEIQSNHWTSRTELNLRHFVDNVTHLFLGLNLHFRIPLAHKNKHHQKPKCSAPTPLFRVYVKYA